MSVLEILKGFYVAVFQWSANQESKNWFPVFVVVGALVLNHLTGFSYYFMNYYKVEQIARVNEVIPNIAMSQEEVVSVQALRHELICRESLPATFWQIIKEAFHMPSPKESSLFDSRGVALSTLKLFLCSAWWVLLFLIFFPLYALYSLKTLPKKRAQHVAFFVIQCMTIFTSFALYNLISNLWDYPLRGKWSTNYVVAFGISTLFLIAAIGMAKYAIKQDKKEKREKETEQTTE